MNEHNINILERLHASYYQLSAAERKVADFVLGQHTQVQFMSITQLAEECGVAEATVSRFCRTFGTLMSSGVPILQAMKITTETLNNIVLQEALEKVHDRVRDGDTLAAPLEQAKVFPPMVCSMVQVGEETGQLPEMLNRVANNYDEEVDNAVGALTSVIEPLLMVFLAIVVGTIVIAMFLPIIDVIKNMTGG